MSNSNDQSIKKSDNQNLGKNISHVIKVGKRQRQNLSGIEQKLKQNYFLNTQQLLRHLSPQTTPQIQNNETLSDYSIKQKTSLDLNPKTHKKSKTVNPGNDIISQLRDASANTYSQDSWKKNRRAKSVSQSRQKAFQTSYNRQSFRNQTMNKELSNSENHGLEYGIMGQQSGGCNSISKNKIELQKLISKNVKKNKFLIQQNHLKQILEAQKIKQKKQNLSQRNEQVRLNNAKKKNPRSQSCIEGVKVRDKLRNRSLDQVKKDFVSVDDFKHRNSIEQRSFRKKGGQNKIILSNQLPNQMEKDISSGSQKHQAFKRQTRNNMIQTAPMVKNKQKAFVEKKQPDPFVALKQLVNSSKFENISDQDVGSPDSRRQEGCRPTDVQEFIQKKKKLFQEKKTLEYVKEIEKVLKVQQNLVQLNQYVQKHMRHKSQPFNFPKKSHQTEFVKVVSPKIKEIIGKQVVQVGQNKKKPKNISELGFKQEKQSGARKKKLKDKKFELTQPVPSSQNKNLRNVILNENSERTIINNEDRRDQFNKKQSQQTQIIKSPISNLSQNYYQAINKQEVTFNQQVKVKNVFIQQQQNSPNESNNQSYSVSNIDLDLNQQNQIDDSNQKKEQGASPQSIEKLRRIQELVGLYRCKFKEGTSDASIMGKLHSAASVIQINFRYIQHLRSIQQNQLNSFDREKIRSQQYQIQELYQNQQYQQQLSSQQNQVQRRVNESNQASQNQDYFDYRASSQMSGVYNIKNINTSTQSKQQNETFISESQDQNTQQQIIVDQNFLQKSISLDKKVNKTLYQESPNVSINKTSNEKNQMINKNDLNLQQKSRSYTVNKNLINEDFSDSKEISDKKNLSLQKLNSSQIENSMQGNRNPQVPGLNLQKLGVQTSLISNSDISSSIKMKSLEENESSSVLNLSAQAKSLQKIQKQRSPNSSLDNQNKTQDLIKIENVDESFQKQLQSSNKEKSGGRMRAQSNDADDRYQNILETQSKQGPVSESNYSEIFNRIGIPLPKSARVKIDYNLVKRDPKISEQLREVINIKKEKGIEVLTEAKKFNLISERTSLSNQKKLEKWVSLALNRIDQEKIGTQSRRSFGAVSLGEFSGRNGGKQSITNQELITLTVNGKQHLDKLMGAADYDKLSARSGTNEKMSARSIRQPTSFRSQSWRANGISGINSQTDFDKIDPYQMNSLQTNKNKNQKLVGLINKNSSRSSTHQDQQQDLSERSAGPQVSPKVDSQEANQESLKKIAQIEKQLENALEKQHKQIRSPNQVGLIFVENQAQEASFSSGQVLNPGEANASTQSVQPIKANNSSYFKHDSSLFDGSHLESDDNKELRSSGQKNAQSTWIDESCLPSEDEKKLNEFQDKKLSTLMNNFVKDGDQNQQNNMIVSPLSSQQIYEFKIQTGAHSLSSNDSDMQKGLRASLHEPLDSPPNLLSPKSVGGISITVGGGGISLDQKSDTISPQSQSLSQVVSGSGIPLRKIDGDIELQQMSESSQQKLEQEQENPQIAFIADKFSETILQVLLYDLQFEMDFVIPRKGKEDNLKKQKGQPGGYQIKFFDKKGIKTDLFAIEKYVDEILEEVKLQSKEFMREISKPVNQDELLVLYQIQTSEIGNFTHFQPKLPDILSLDLYLKIEKRRKESREKGQLQTPISDGLFDFENINENDLTADRVDKNFLAECLHIHNKIIFDCINDSLQQFRPNGKDGLPKSWSTQNRKLKATEDFSLEEMFEITKHDLFRMAIMQAGTLPRREFVFSGQFDEDLFGEIREKKLATLLCREIVDTENQWLKWEFEESQTKIDIADMVLETLIVETVDFLNKQQHVASLQF